jgi:hypothetical protein
VQAAADGGEGWLLVQSLVEADGPSGWRVRADGPLSELLASGSLGVLGAAMAVDADGILRGVVTTEQLRRAMSSALGT